VTRLAGRSLFVLCSLSFILAACGSGGSKDAGLGGTPSDGDVLGGANGTGGLAGGTGAGGAAGETGSTAAPTCGLPGYACCSGNACTNGGCCVNGVCAAPQAVCGVLGGVCNAGTCGTCGGAGLNCCLSGGVGICTASGTNCWNNICVACGSAGQNCCAGNTCLGSGLVCNGSICVAGTPTAGAGGTSIPAGGAGGMTGAGGSGGKGGGVAGGVAGVGGGAAGAGGGGSCGCPTGKICTAEGRCILPGTIDDFGSCDINTYAAEGRKGTWYTYMGLGVSCEYPPCGGIGIPPWGTVCGAWTNGGLYDTLDAYAGFGVGLNGAGVTYDACGYTSIEVTYATDQAIRMYAKWNDTGTTAPRAYVTLPATTGTATSTVSLSMFTGLVCSKLTELQFEPSSIAKGFGVAVYGLRFLGTGSTTTCTEGDVRCASGGGLEKCTGGAWIASACPTGQTCVSNKCTTSTVTGPPVQVHGNLKVVGTKLVDQNGTPVQLKGVSSQWLNYETDGYATNLDALIWMRDNWKLSVIRAAMGVDPDQDGAYLYSAEGKANMQTQLEAVIKNAVAAGVYVIVDWHSHMADQYTADANAFFTDIAKRYGQNANIIYETYNEPLKVAWTTLKQYHQSVYVSIRNWDPDNVILLGTPNWDQDVDVAAANPMAGDTNIMYTLHFYACTHNSAKGQLAKAKSALSSGLPIFVSEWGATAADGGAGGTSVCTSYADEWHAWMDANSISWAAWKLDDCDGLAVADTSCILKLNAPVTGGWTSAYLNGHGPYVVGQLTK
jgi:aryl-phospho-beta-D-glucosidase BglC (GH1 family)